MEKNLLLEFSTRRCSHCVMPEVKGHNDLDENGLCSLCRKELILPDESKQAQFNDMSSERKKEIFLKKMQRFKTDGEYDCLVAVSGGKDSIMTLYIAHEMGLQPLALFIDNGFALPEMYDNIRSAADKLGIEWFTYRTNRMKALFCHLLKSRKNIYYCRVCHIILESTIKDICKKYGIRLILGGYTKGQSYLKQEALSWIFEESDRNTLDVIRSVPELRYLEEMFTDPIKYSIKNYREIVQISPFKYLDYDEDRIIAEIHEKLGFRLPEHSWPAHSTNCSFNYASQYLAVKQFGYSQHETEFSDLVRSGEMSRERAEELINTPITDDDLSVPLSQLGLTKNEII